MEVATYNQRTFNSPHPIVRFAHRQRMARSLVLAQSTLGDGRLLDYGCGSGAFVEAMAKHRPGCAVGYEPFLGEAPRSLPVYGDLRDVQWHAPFSLITLWETIEHLTADELGDFLRLARPLLDTNGQVLISAPIEIGPALLVKEAYRTILRGMHPEETWGELVKAACLGIPAPRALDIKSSHRGYDFRDSIRHIRLRGWRVEVLGYGPLPIGTWYGNSQVYLTATPN